ncbi:MAG: phosphoadenylyl-sulfate reductase [Alphaproteobacteria bacterium]|jgi:phosphoadenosine phosphosulfate reductase|nr:phosphoadenylyl-sulfate reductase [Alphaproteobacteria bacterium]MBT5859650.1 phosphoadenylyl-sulfate reductase [Alphaproteobacteria bacterium]
MTADAKIDLPPETPSTRLDMLVDRYAGATAQEIMAGAIHREFPGRVALVSSFGAEAAVQLHMVAQVSLDVPVIFLDTEQMFPETLEYRDTLTAHLKMRDVRTVVPPQSFLQQIDPDGILWQTDPDECCRIRKFDPLAAVLDGFDAWFTGRKRYQIPERARLSVFEESEGRVKINPLAEWTKAAVDGYFEENRLPRHPLEAEQFLSIGCAPCTSPVSGEEDPRTGRWRGFDKVECGIHLPSDSD